MTGSLSRRHLEAIAKLPDDQQLVVDELVKTQRLTAQATEKVGQEKTPRAAG